MIPTWKSTLQVEATPFDTIFNPELMYSECSKCGRPILLDPYKTRELLELSGIAPDDLDYSRLILTDGCPSCTPEKTGFRSVIAKPKSAEAYWNSRPDSVSGTA